MSLLEYVYLKHSQTDKRAWLFDPTSVTVKLKSEDKIFGISLNLRQRSKIMFSMKM